MASSFSFYLMFGFIFVLVGIVVSYFSVGMVRNGGSFGSALPDSAMTLFIGGFIVLVGLLLLLLGFFSSTH
ncbi:MAG TPA: hypothetical protein VLU95_06565, partial [Candidatus Acidoferrum sp.]|nr:hypothetical protein [Candidatus Acidoferrum sp.]